MNIDKPHSAALFTYAPDGRRVYEVLSERYFPNPGDVGQNRVRYIVQGQRGYQVELASDASGWSNATYRHEIGDVSVVLRAVTGQATTRDVAYKTTDRLGSPLGILDKTGQFRQRAESGVMSNANTQLNFSPFGAAREPTFQPRPATDEMPGRLNLTPSTRLGFTGHEHLDSLGLIHMNGRVYDYRLGRFLSVDPFIQFPANSQSLNPYSYIMNNPMAGTDPTGYKARDKRRFLVGGESCGGDESCERDQTMSGPVENFRGSFSSGGAPSGTWSGYEAKQQIRKAQNNARATVEVGELVDLSTGVMLAQEGTMSNEDIREVLGEEDPRAGARRGAKTAGRIMDALGDVIEPGPEDAIGVLGKAKDLKKVGEAVGKSIDELSELRKASDAAKGLGGFKVGITADEISALNRTFGNGVAYREVDTVLANASRYDGFFNKSASVIRDIAGGHLFENGNKRTAVAAVEMLIARNGVDGPPQAVIWNVVDRVATGQLKDVQAISKALQGF